MKQDYPWLAHDLLMYSENGDENRNVAELENRVYQDALTRANIPRPPPHYVKRTKWVSKNSKSR